MIRRTFCLSCGAENRGVHAQCLLCHAQLVWPAEAQPAATQPAPKRESPAATQPTPKREAPAAAQPTPKREAPAAAQPTPKREAPAPAVSASNPAPKPVPEAAPKPQRRGLRVVLVVVLLVLLTAGAATAYLAVNGNRRARALIDREQYASAIRWGDWMTRLRLPANADTYVLRGRAYAHLGMHDAAFLDFIRAGELSPGHDVTAFGLQGYLLEKEGDLQAALRYYDEGIRRNPRDARARIERGRTYAKLGRHDLAVQDFVEALRIEPGNVNAANRLRASAARLNGPLR